MLLISPVLTATTSSAAPRMQEDGDADRSQRCGADAAVIHQSYIFQPVGWLVYRTQRTGLPLDFI